MNGCDSRRGASQTTARYSHLPATPPNNSPPPPPARLQVGMAVAVMRGAAPEECLTLALKSSAGQAAGHVRQGPLPLPLKPLHT